MKDSTCLRETDEVCTETESSTLTSSDADRGGEGIKDGEHGSCNDGNTDNFVHRETLTRNEHHCNSNGETFN